MVPSSCHGVKSEGENVVDIHLKYNGEESNSDDEFIESAPIGRIKNEMEELDQKNIDKTFDNDVTETGAIKKETNDVNEEKFHSIPFKLEFIKQEEVHIKNQEDIEDSLNENILEPGKQTVLDQCPDWPYSTNDHILHSKTDSNKHKNGVETCHTEIHNNSMLTCSKCSYKTLKQTNFKKHEMRHKPNVKWQQCPECSYKTDLRDLFQRHILTHKSDVYKCLNCPYQTGRKYLFTIHQVKHESMDKWHSCALCPFKTYSKNVIRKHSLRRHSIDPNNPNQIEIFKCSECPYESGCRSKVKTHQMIHNQSSWFQCSECTYKTPYKSGLKKHRVRHQEENTTSWHRCLECSYKTPHKPDLWRHVITHKATEEVEWFKCLQCSYKTAYKNNLRQHQLRHKEEQDVEWFCCYECSFKTKHRRSIICHTSKHKKQIDKG